MPPGFEPVRPKSFFKKVGEVTDTTASIKLIMVDRDGVEPPESKTADLQSAPLPLTVYLSIGHVLFTEEW